MSNYEMSGLDLIRELRLRQWARSNYVAPDGRSQDWHPVVLDEMKRRDEELHEHGQDSISVTHAELCA